MHREVDGKELKLQVSTEAFYTILTKEKGFGLQGTINSGEVTMKCMGKTNETYGLF